jgi:hypothetical protein
MPRKLFVLTLALSALLTLHAQAVARDLIPAGTILQCTLDEPNFSAKTAMVGDPILCHLSSLSSFGHPVFPRGAMLSGHLEDYKNPGHFVGKGWIQLEFDRLVLPGAEVLPIAAKIISAQHTKVDKQGDVHGKGHPKRDAVEWMIPILWPIKVITLPARGPYPAFKGETRLALRLMEDVEFPVPVGRNSVPMPPWATPSVYQSDGYNGSLQPSPGPHQAAGVQPVAYATRTQEYESPKLTIIALKGGSAFLAAQYWLQGGLLHCVSSGGEDRLLPLERLDLEETTRVNRERNVDFVLRSRDVLEQ